MVLSPVLKKISSRWLSVELYWITSVRTQIFFIKHNSAGMFLCGTETHYLLTHDSEINKFPESKLPCSSSLGLVKKSSCIPYSVTNFLYDLWQMAYFPSWKILMNVFANWGSVEKTILSESSFCLALRQVLVRVREVWCSSLAQCLLVWGASAWKTFFNKQESVVRGLPISLRSSHRLQNSVLLHMD